MSKSLLVRSSFVLSLILGFAGCTIHPDDNAPPLTGPSSFGRSLTVSVSPDNITADGSQATITASFLDSNGAPLSGIPLRLSISVGGSAVEFGALSSRSAYTDSTGRAVVAYYSPVVSGFFAGTPAREVWVEVEPVGANYATTIPQHATLKVTPPPVPILGVDAPVAAVTYLPTSPKVGDNVMFDARGSQPASGHTIVNYFWDFGDGRLNDEHGEDASHAYASAGQYTLVLGVTDEAGRSSSTFKTIIVSK
jgi:PKD repeat protein